MPDSMHLTGKIIVQLRPDYASSESVKDTACACQWVCEDINEIGQKKVPIELTSSKLQKEIGTKGAYLKEDITRLDKKTS